MQEWNDWRLVETSFFHDPKKFLLIDFAVTITIGFLYHFLEWKWQNWKFWKMRLRWALDKVAGFVDKSLRIDTNWAFLKKTISETNPQIESLRFGLTNPDLRWIQDSRIQILMYLFRILVLKIRNHENRLNLLKIGWIRGPQLKNLSQDFKRVQ